MTLAEVDTAVQTLEAAGHKVTYETILAQLGGGSRRDLARLLPLLRDQDVDATVSMTVPEETAPGPVSSGTAPPKRAPHVSLPNVSVAPQGPVPCELTRFRTDYQRAWAALQAAAMADLSSPERYAFNAVQYDFARREKIVRFCLTRARKEHGQTSQAARTCYADDLAEVVKFVGEAAALALVPGTAEPRWTLEA